jgi:phosphate transport system permease protein
LLSILVVLVRRGLAGFDLGLFTQRPHPPGIPGGGLANAILGSALLTGLAVLMAVPVGVLGGIYLSEFAGGSRLAAAFRFAVNSMLGVPSIVLGLFVWSTLVVAMGSFSAWAGSAALALIMIPVVVRTTEDMLRMIPDALRESVLAMGAPRWQLVRILLRAARQGILTGVLLGVARISGETAPLLFTALNSPYWPKDPGAPTANLPVTIFNYAMSPYADWQAKAWAASLLVTLFVLVLSLAGRWGFRSKEVA